MREKLLFLIVNQGSFVIPFQSPEPEVRSNAKIILVGNAGTGSKKIKIKFLKKKKKRKEKIKIRKQKNISKKKLMKPPPSKTIINNFIIIGKSCLVRQYAEDGSFDPSSRHTIGVEYYWFVLSFSLSLVSFFKNKKRKNLILFFSFLLFG